MVQRKARLPGAAPAYTDAVKILVLGGTKFVGRAFVDAALAGGHDLTLVHRGRSGAGLFPACEHVLLDRSDGYAPLAGRGFDAAIDVSAYVPRVAGGAAREIRAERWLFVSTISVYADFPPEGTDEDADLHAEVRGTEEVSGETYGGLKVACERDVLAARPGATIVRPGMVAGAYDPTNRLTYWVRRFAQADADGGEVLTPVRWEQPLQLIDARDLAGFMLHRLEAGTGGVWNAVGPDHTLGGLYEELAARFPAARPASVPDLEAKGLRLGRDLPLVQTEDGAEDGVFRVSARRALGDGLVQRPLGDTVDDVAAWLSREDPGVGASKYGLLTPEREEEILRSRPMSR